MNLARFLLALVAGGGLSLFYFGGLWLTVQHVVETRRSKMLLLGSFVVRTMFVLAGFYVVIWFMGDRWELLAASLLGFIVGRTILVRRWRPRPAPTPSS